MLLRPISLPMHGALELVAGLAVAITPIVMGLPPAGILAAVVVGVTMIGLAIGASAPAGSGALPVQAHAGYDKLLAAALLATGVGAGIAGNPRALAFFAAAGLVYAALIAVTRYTARA